MERVLSRRFVLVSAILSVMLSVLPANVWAQAYPSRPITIIFPFPSGAPSDNALRVIGNEISKPLGQPVIVESRPGGSGINGVNALKNGKPDGYELVLLHSGMTVVRAAADPSFKFEVGKDYDSVVGLWSSVTYWLANPSAPFHDLKGMIAYAKANPGKLDAGINIGSTDHIALVTLQARTGISMTLIPFKGSRDRVNALLGGVVPFTAISQSQKQYVDAGRLVLMATGGKHREPDTPNIPTVAETIPELSDLLTTWVGLLCSAGTPRAIIAQLNNLINASYRVPAVQAAVKPNGNVVGGTPEQIDARVRSEIKTYGPTIAKMGLKFN